MDPVPARLTVARTSPDDVGQRQIVLTLDSQPLATLLAGESVTRDISAGSHRLRAHNTLVWKTVDFDAAPGEHVRFSTVNRAGPRKHGARGAARRRTALRHARAGTDAPEP